jgi:hypothetical protein
VRLTITTKLVQRRTPESSAFTATARFFDDSSDAWAASTPTTIDYRIDRIRRGDPSCYSQVRDWTVVTPATSASIAVTATDNEISDEDSRDQDMQLTVTANRGLATQVSQTYRYRVENLAAQVAA